jgi:heterotetrameric sarcosine oxidase gamma subunit
MAELTANRVSALAANYPVGMHGNQSAGEGALQFSEGKDLVLWQVAAWPDTFESVASKLVGANGPAGAAAPGFGQSVASGDGAILRTEPLKFWVVGAEPPAFDATDAVCVDLSHSRTLIKLKGERATTVLNSYLPLDLRESAFPVGTVASTAFHHCGVTLWRSADHYELFLPRGFALSLWELLMEGAMQYGFEVS